MLTPNEIRDQKKFNKQRAKLSPATAHLLKIKLYELVLREIAKGSVDPKSLAIAALEPE